MPRTTPIGSSRARIGAVAAGLLLLSAAPVATAAEVTAGDGIEIASEDGSYRLKLGARVMWDTDSFDGALNRDHDGDWRFNSGLRRARVEMSGNLSEDFEFVFDVNVQDDAEVHAAGIEYTGWRFVNVFVGRTKEPFGLEELTSSKALTTIERNYFNEATDVDSQPHFGVLLNGRAAGIGWSAGIFSPEGNPQRSDGGDRLAFTGRLFGAPIRTDERVLHLGAAYTDRNVDQPLEETGFALDIAENGGELDSASILIDEDRQVGLEALFIQGPVSLQAEAFRRQMSGAAGGPDGQVDQQYVQASWTLTGESRGYEAHEGIPNMIQPTGRRGAVELVAKVDWIRFDVDGAPDQEVEGLLIGANWYATRHVKLMANVIRVSSDRVVAPGEDDDATVFSTRVQFTF